MAFSLTPSETNTIIFKRDSVSPSLIRFGNGIKKKSCEGLLYDAELLKVHEMHDLKLLLLQAVKSRVLSIPNLVYSEESKE